MNREEIRILLIKAHYKLLSESEMEFVAQLIIQDEDAKAIHSELQALLHSAPLLAPHEVNKEWETLLSKLPSEDISVSSVAPKRITPTLRWVVAIAAGLVLVAFASYFLVGKFSKDQPSLSGLAGVPTLTLENGQVITLGAGQHHDLEHNGFYVDSTNHELHLNATAQSTDIAWSTLSVPNKMVYKIFLPDSTIMWVNSATEIRFPNRFEKNRRRVELISGEVFFDVRKNAAAAFEVQTDKGDIEVLGTQFNINNYNPDHMKTALIEGSIKLKFGGQHKVIKPMQEAITTSDDSSPILIKDLESLDVLSWRTGIIPYDVSLDVLQQYVFRFYDTEIHLDDPALKKIHFRGKLDRGQSIEDFVETLNLTGEITLYWKDKQLRAKK